MSHDTYSQPMSAESTWWSNFAKTTVPNVLGWGDAGEIMIDGITKFATKMENGFCAVRKGAGFQFMVTRKHAHEEIVIDALFLRSKGAGGLVVDKWLAMCENGRWTLIWESGYFDSQFLVVMRIDILLIFIF